MPKKATWTNKKISALFWLTWLSVNGAEAGQAFKNCLTYHGNAYVYDELGEFFSNNAFPNDGTFLLLCCNIRSNCSSVPIATGCPSDANIRWFPCTKINQTIFCGDKTCAGTVGNDLITSNNILGKCKDNLANVSNYLSTISPYNKNEGFPNWPCSDNGPCSGLNCAWDNEGWTCYNFDFGLSNSCFLQLPAPFPGPSSLLSSTSTIAESASVSFSSTSSPSFSGNTSPSDSSSNYSPNWIIVGATVGGIIVIGGSAIVSCIIHQRKKSESISQNKLDKLLKQFQNKIQTHENKEESKKYLNFLDNLLEDQRKLINYQNSPNSFDISESQIKIIKDQITKNRNNLLRILTEEEVNKICQLQEEITKLKTRKAYQIVNYNYGDGAIFNHSNLNITGGQNIFGGNNENLDQNNIKDNQVEKETVLTARQQQGNRWVN